MKGKCIHVAIRLILAEKGELSRWEEWVSNQRSIGMVNGGDLRSGNSALEFS
ncbi:MAG: hypothetical protein Kow0088_02960 [Anaerolineales bacterium]